MINLIPKLTQLILSKIVKFFSKLKNINNFNRIIERGLIKYILSFIESKILPKVVKIGGDDLKSLLYKFRSLVHRKIFGIGLSRTGTKSLTLALKELGYKARHYPPENRLFEMVERYDALTDTPIAYNFKLLDKKYPHSKFILTIRDIESWLRSCENHIRITKPSEKWQLDLRKKLYGTIDWDEDKFRETYVKHLKDVKIYFKNRPNDFLILNVIGGEGYEKLCTFLNKKIKSKPFPYANIGNFSKE